MREDLVNWIRNTSKKESIDWIYDSLIKTGYTESQFQEELSHIYGASSVSDLFYKKSNGVTISDSSEIKANDDYPKPPIGKSNTFIIDGRVCNILVDVKLPRIIMIDNFLSHSECEKIIELARPNIKRSMVVNHDEPGSKLHKARTSKGTFFSKAQTDLIADIEKRVSVFTNWPQSHQETMQVLNYSVDEEYQPHFDYFDPNAKTTEATLKRGGQRVATMIMYLNDCAGGGGTVFPDAGIEVHPKKGCAVFFSYPTPTPSNKSRHGGQPVVTGEKWIAVKWLRQSEFS